MKINTKLSPKNICHESLLNLKKTNLIVNIKLTCVVQL